MSGVPGQCKPQPTCTCSKVHLQPESYVGASMWADDLLQTHRQRQCKACHLWHIWVPR